LTQSILSYTDNGGATWKPITALSGNPGSHPWVVPYVITPKFKCKVRIVLKDAYGYRIVSDVSDKYFTIQP
jgi:hypothetical protein